ncbi:MAG TPA: signal peptidase II [Streptosporangiaceae bacterium]|nr:signal peptidase II [Streptosporangiaceae bacterium]
MAAPVVGSRRHTAGALWIALAVCAADVVSKVLVVADLAPQRPVTLLSGLITLHLYRNPGAAFGIGPSYTVVFALIEAGALAAILRLSRRLKSWPWSVALGLLLGGAAGNLADRLFRSPGPLQGFVVDWIKLPYFPPTFNLADSAITIGAVLLVLATARGWQLDGSGSRPEDKVPPAGLSEPTS